MKVSVAFNGDADGLLALHQLRLSGRVPAEAVLISGIKRDVRLLSRVPEDAEEVWALDISLDANREALLALLAKGVHLHWRDHHFAGEIPKDPKLDARIDPSPDRCTSLIVSDELDRAHLPWAIAAAFGDNLHEQALCLAKEAGLREEQIAQLRRLGELLNYNGYGLSIDDLHLHPVQLAAALAPYDDPWRFVQQSEAFAQLQEGYAEDRRQAEQLKVYAEGKGWAVFLLPDAAWARRMIGVLANELARRHPERAHALCLPMAHGAFRVSVRAPKARPWGADALCRKFPSGGGRAGAAGINALPKGDLDRFVAAFAKAYGR